MRKKAKDDGSSLTENVLDDFARRHIDKKCRPNTAKEYKRQIETEIKPKWKGRDIRSITRRNVSSLIDAIADRAPTLANRVLALLRKFFAWCEERDIVDLSPLTKRITPPRRRRAGNESCPTMKSGCSGKPATRSAGPLAR
ncbi:site-specific integrase [Rhizobium sp. BK251]|uniref:phage integrase central domain-containing protein n=1 Tax=Rhizobium sp. BK251 TaxID=2512125 RepID=UPI0032AF5280